MTITFTRLFTVQDDIHVSEKIDKERNSHHLKSEYFLTKELTPLSVPPFTNLKYHQQVLMRRFFMGVLCSAT